MSDYSTPAEQPVGDEMSPAPQAYQGQIAQPNRIDILRLPILKAEPWVSVQPGADDHRAISSRGIG